MEEKGKMGGKGKEMKRKGSEKEGKEMEEREGKKEGKKEGKWER